MKLKSSLQKFSLVFLLLCFLFLYGLSPRPVLAAGKIFTFDASLSSGITTGFSSILSGDMSNFSLGQASTKFFEEMLPKMGAKVLSSVLRTALNQIAFDTANSLASARDKSQDFSLRVGGHFCKMLQIQLLEISLRRSRSSL